MSFKKTRLFTANTIPLVISVWKKDGWAGFFDHLKFFVKINTQKCFAKQAFKNGKIVFISECPGSSMRYRCHHAAEQLQNSGINTQVYEISAINFKKCVEAHQCIILHRVLYTPERQRIIKSAQKKGKIVVFDTDDLIFDTDTTQSIQKLPPVQFTFLKGEFERAQKMLKCCDYAIGSTTKMRDALEKFLPNRCFVHENMVSDEEIERAEQVTKLQSNKFTKTNSVIVLGYASGTRTHDDDFLAIEKPLLKILSKYPQVQLRIIGPLNLSPRFRPFKNQIQRKKLVHWKNLPTELTQFDINLAPLENIPLNEAKSDLKFFEAACVGIPTIATKMGAFREHIEEGKTGFLAEGEPEWFEKMEILISNPRLRNKIGANAYTYVIEKRGTKVGSKNIKKVIQKINPQIFDSP